jgi:hypothetical protein
MSVPDRTELPLVTGLAQDDITRMRDQLFFDSPERPPCQDRRQ